MIYYFMDKQMNYLTHIDTEADAGIAVIDKSLTDGIVRGVRLQLLNMTIAKSDIESAKITGPHYVIFNNALNENVCLSITNFNDETENTRPFVCEDLGMELLNGSAIALESSRPQFIEYYVNRELYATGWEIGINELANNKKLQLDFSEETPLSRLQTLCEAFNCEMSFSVELQNLRVVKKLINIRHKLGSDHSDKILYSGVDVMSITKSVDYTQVVTAVRDTNHGFDKLSTGDGRYFTRTGESIVYDRVARAEYGPGNTQSERSAGYNYKDISTNGTTPAENYAQALKLLQELNEPKLDADVEVLFDDADFESGDYVTFVDEEYNPPLRIKARIIEKTSSSNERNRMSLGNYSLLESRISSDLLALQQKIGQTERLIPDIEVNVTREGLKVVAEVKLLLNGKDVTHKLKTNQFYWEKFDKEGNLINWEPNINGSLIVDDLNNVDSINYYQCTVLYSTTQYIQARYFINGLVDANAKVMRLQNENTVTIAHISDTHNATDTEVRADLTNYERSPSHVLNVVESTNNIDYDAVVLNGDVHDGGTTKDIALRDYKAVMSAFTLSNAPFFTTVGNHCDNSWGAGRSGSTQKTILNYKPKKTMVGMHGRLSQVISPNEIYDIITRPSTIFPIVENKENRNNYYYYDVPKKNFRMIFLNSFDIPYVNAADGFAKYQGLNVAGYREQQLQWLAETLKNTPAHYHVALFQHYPFGLRYTADMEYLPYNYELLDGILKAFINGTTYTGSYTANLDFKASISVSFNRKGVIAFLAHGHTHNDRITKDGDGIINVSIGCSVSLPKKGFSEREIGTLEEDLWDTMVIDTKKRKVDLIRFGAGNDRQFVY